MVEKIDPRVFNRSVLLTCLAGDEAGVAEICQAFLADFPNDIAALRSFLAAEDMESLECKAHGIKGAAANMGSETLRQAALELEQSAQTEDLAVLRQQVDNLEVEFARLQQVVTSLL